MKKKYFKAQIIFLILSFASFTISGQEIHFAYDNYGNRINRDIIYLIISDISPEAQINPEENKIKGEISGITISITPNPNEGHFVVELENFSSRQFDQVSCQIYILNLSGDQVYYLNKIRKKNQVDISDQPNGIYILSIVIGDQKMSWKVVKA